MHELTARWVCGAIRWRWPVLLAFAAATVASLVYTAGNLRMNTDTADLLSPRLPFLQTYRRYKEQFPQYADSLVAVVEAGTPEGARRAALALSQRLRQHPDRFRNVYLPRADPFFQRNALLFMDLDALDRTMTRLIEMQPFLGRVLRDPSLRGLAAMLESGLEAVQAGRHLSLGPALEVLERAIRARLDGNGRPVSWQGMLLADPTGQAAARQLVVFQPRLDFSTLYPAEAALRSARALAQDVTPVPGERLRIRFTGEPAMADEEMRSVARGMGWAAAGSLAMVLAVLYAGLRSLRLTAAVLATLLVGLALTAGFATLAVGTLNMISVVFAVLYIGLGVDFGIHWTLALRERLLAGRAVIPALGHVGHHLGPALTLCALTTAAGFFAFMPTDYRGVSELGLIAGCGMLIALFCTLSLLPALLGTAGIAGAARGSAAGLPTRVAAWPHRHARVLRLGTLILVAAGLILLPRVRFDPDPLHLRDPDGEAVATYRALMHGADPRPPAAVALADSAAEARTLAQRLAASPRVEAALWLGSFVPSDQDEKLDRIDELALVMGPELGAELQPRPAPPEENLQALRSLAAEIAAARANDRSPPALRPALVGLEQSLDAFLDRLDRLPETERRRRLSALERDLLYYLPDNIARLARALEAEPVTLETLPPRLARRWRSEQGRWRVAAHPAQALDTARALREFVAAVGNLVPEITGGPVLDVEAARVVVRAFAQAFALAAAAIVLLLAVTLRRAADVLTVLAPLATASLLTGALMALLDIPFNFANIIALPLLLGVGVDNGIHMVTRIRAGDANPLAHATGRAVLVSALTTLASFGSLGLSHHPGTASLGQVLTLGLVLTLAATLVMLPALRSGPIGGHTSTRP